MVHCEDGMDRALSAACDVEILCPDTAPGLLPCCHDHDLSPMHTTEEGSRWIMGVGHIVDLLIFALLASLTATEQMCAIGTRTGTLAEAMAASDSGTGFYCADKVGVVLPIAFATFISGLLRGGWPLVRSVLKPGKAAPASTWMRAAASGFRVLRSAARL